jgi:hypothetical protein
MQQTPQSTLFKNPAPACALQAARIERSWATLGNRAGETRQSIRGNVSDIERVKKNVCLPVDGTDRSNIARVLSSGDSCCDQRLRSRSQSVSAKVIFSPAIFRFTSIWFYGQECRSTSSPDGCSCWDWVQNPELNCNIWKPFLLSCATVAVFCCAASPRAGSERTRGDQLQQSQNCRKMT